MEALPDSGRLLDPLTRDEADALWLRLVRGLRATSGELALLEKCPPAVRDMLYGPGVLAAYYGLRDDLADLLDDGL